MTTLATTETRMADEPLRRLLRFARPLRPALLVAVGAGVLSVGCGVALLAVSGFLIARASEHPNEVALAAAVVGVRAFGVGRGVFRYVERLSSHDAAFRVLADLRVAVFERLERVAGSGYRQLRGGDLVARLVSDVDGVQEVFVRGLTPPLVAFGVGAAAGIAATAIFAPAGLALVLGLLIAGIAVPGLAVRLSAGSDARLAAARGELSAHAGDVIGGAAELIAYGADQAALESFETADQLVTRISRRSAVGAALGSGLASLCVGATVWAVLLVAVVAQSGGGLSRVGLAAVVLTALASFEATAPLSSAVQQLAGARSSARRIFEVTDLPVLVTEPAVPDERPTGPIRLRVTGARMRYSPSGRAVLDGIDLDLPPGRHIALIGRSGAGKSSLVTALMRFRDLDEGEITLNGVSFTRLRSDDIHRVIGGCLADPHIFDSTVRENLRLARPAASDAELEEVAERVRLLDWIRGLPLGWDTPVGSHGQVMSGGQRQRLALARALLADFPVLVLDEPTAHLDDEAAEALMADIKQATADRTLLLITHDPRQTAGFDEVLVMESGRFL